MSSYATTNDLPAYYPREGTSSADAQTESNNNGSSLLSQSNAANIDNMVINVEPVDGEDLSTTVNHLVADLIMSQSQMAPEINPADSEAPAARTTPQGSSHRIIVVVVNSPTVSAIPPPGNASNGDGHVPPPPPYTPLPFNQSLPNQAHIAPNTHPVVPLPPPPLVNPSTMHDSNACRRHQRALPPSESPGLLSTVLLHLPFVSSMSSSYASRTLKRRRDHDDVEAEEECDNGRLVLPIKRRRREACGADRARRTAARRRV